MKKLIAAVLGIVVLFSGASIASATGLVDNSITNTATGGAASATGGTHVQTNTQATTTVVAPVQTNTQLQNQGQNQGQQQGQLQGQGQGQKQSANNEGINISSPVQDRMPGLAVAPGLTAAGTGVCLGSVSFGLSGPMAGASFGITKVDKGCEQRSGAALLYNMGYQKAALRVLAGESIQDALAAEGQLPGSVKAAAAKASVVAPAVAASEITGVDQQVLSTNFAVQGN